MALILYCDDSGDSKPEAIGGCIALASEWDVFAQEWRVLLDEFKVSWFHAAQFESCRGEFKDWRDKPEERQRFRDRVAAIANQRVLAYVGSVVPPYAQLKPLPQPENIHEAKEIAWGYEWKRMERDPYSVALSSCLARAIRNVARPMKERLDIVLSHQAGRIGNASLVHTAAGVMPEFDQYLGNLVQGESQNPRAVLPLQLADLVAWDVYRQRSRRGVWTAMLRKRPYSFGTAHRIFDNWLSGGMDVGRGVED